MRKYSFGNISMLLNCSQLIHLNFVLWDTFFFYLNKSKIDDARNAWKSPRRFLKSWGEVSEEINGKTSEGPFCTLICYLQTAVSFVWVLKGTSQGIKCCKHVQHIVTCLKRRSIRKIIWVRCVNSRAEDRHYGNLSLVACTKTKL